MKAGVFFQTARRQSEPEDGTSSETQRRRRNSHCTQTLIERVRRNIQSRIPRGAQLARLGSKCPDECSCDGCKSVIESDHPAYELEFRANAEIVTIRLHRECWESWRIEELSPSRFESFLSPQDSRHGVYVCTQHCDGSITGNECHQMQMALSVLRTFLNTARRMGYRIRRPDISGHMGGKFIAQNDTASLAFWISETDESTESEPIALLK